MSVASLVCFGVGAACSGDAFTSSDTPDAGGGAGVAGDSDNEAGEGGSNEDGAGGALSGGRGGASPSAGSAGKPPAGCELCVTGEYCQDGTYKCRKCTDYTRLEFGSPQKLLSQSAQASKRFARPASLGSALFYVAGAADNARILYAVSPVSGMGTPVTAQGQVESGPLLAKGFADRDLFFDRKEAGERKLYMANWSAPSTLTNEELMPGEINEQGSDDYSVALSPKTGNVYWMSTRNGAAELLWQPTNLDGPPAPAPLELTLKVGKAECPRAGEDATPWVNQDGTLLLFRNPSLNESCDPNDSGATDLFAVGLKPDGTPEGPARALSSLNNTGGMSRETDPTLSNDSCSIYFATDNGSGAFDLYKAPRN
ncbi:MAG TPA: hypothetical protein VFK05_03615 [Polyangiaceae bacterium]|nr:hypothetical protein [Polyangiaceae bacterium]